jgi:hypothetical protein
LSLDRRRSSSSSAFMDAPFMLGLTLPACT